MQDALQPLVPPGLGYSTVLYRHQEYSTHMHNTTTEPPVHDSSFIFKSWDHAAPASQVEKLHVSEESLSPTKLRREKQILMALVCTPGKKSWWPAVKEGPCTCLGESLTGKRQAGLRDGGWARTGAGHRALSVLRSLGDICF